MDYEEAIAIVKGFCIREVQPEVLEDCLYGEGNAVLEPLMSDCSKPWSYPITDSPYDDLLDIDIQREPEKARMLLREFIATLVPPGDLKGEMRRFQHLVVEQVRPAPTEKQISAIENLLGTTLPDCFIEFLDVANGAYLDYVVDVPFCEGKTEQRSFCGVFSTDNGTIGDSTFVGEIRSARENFNIPTSMLPFALDGGGSTAFLDLSPEGDGRVVAFVHGISDLTELDFESSWIEIAASFDKYVGMLRVDRLAIIDNLIHDVEDISQIDAIEEKLNLGMPDWRDDQEIIRALNKARLRLEAEVIKS